MIPVRLNSIDFYVFESLAPLSWLTHAVLARKGPDGRDWTLTFGGPENAGSVASNLASVEELLDAGPLAIVGQVHGTEALVLDPGQSYAPKSPDEVLHGYDAIVGGPGQAMMVRLADCQGVILADPATRTVAVVHSGWRGTAADILGRTVALLASKGIDPKGLLAAAGPSLGPCCAEMVNYRQELPEPLWGFKADKPDHFDFWAMTRHQLETAGLSPANIEIAGRCTRCDPEFYSYRRGDKGRFGVAAGVLA
jgi:YfiH family protein